MNDEICPVAEAAKSLGDKWVLVIVRDLAEGPRRFVELERSGEGISPGMLTHRLKVLEANGFVTRTSYNEIPPRVEHCLTETGADALPVNEALRTYGTRWLLPDSAVAV